MRRLCVSSAAGAQAARVGGEHLEQHVLDDDREPERHQQRRQDVLAERAVQDAALQAVAGRDHHRQHHGEEQRAGRRGTPSAIADGEERREHDEVAVRDVHQAHHAEHERRARPRRARRGRRAAGPAGRCRSSRSCRDARAEVRAEIAARVSSLDRPVQRHAALLEAVQAVRRALRDADVLLDHDHRQPFAHHRRAACRRARSPPAARARARSRRRSAGAGWRAARGRSRPSAAGRPRARCRGGRAAPRARGRARRRARGSTAPCASRSRRSAGSPRPRGSERAGGPRAPSRCPAATIAARRHPADRPAVEHDPVGRARRAGR